MVAESDNAPTTSLILVVDDEPTVREMVGLNLRAEGHDVIYAADGNEALAKARGHAPDVIVLDVMLPGRDGFDICRTLRAESGVPILLLSARGEELDRVLGLEIGADDYLTKPFAMRELVARVRALLRRQQLSRERPGGDEPVASADGEGSGSDTITVGDLALSPSRHEAWVRGESLELTSKEFALLHYLMRHPGIALSRDALLREVWGYDYPVGTRTVDVHISWLRHKIEAGPPARRRIQTVRGHGYRLVSDDVAAAKDLD